jgi:hypothetical protein
MKTVVAGVLLLVLMVFVSSAGRSLADDVHGSSRAGGSGGLLHIPSAYSLAHCPSRCGDVNISYPFRIGRGCFRQGFELTCDHTTHPPKLLFGNGTTTQITSQYFGTNYGTAHIGFNVTMSPGVDTYVSWKTLDDEGLIIDGDFGNNLFVVGCNVDVVVFGDNMTTDPIGSCMSMCTGDRETMERMNFHGSCSGFGCCSIPLLRALAAFTVKLARRLNVTRPQLLEDDDEMISNVKVFLSQTYTFATADLYMSWVNISNNAIDAVTKIAIKDQPNCERAGVNKDTYACNDERQPLPLRCRWLHPRSIPLCCCFSLFFLIVQRIHF